jgi:hypothetical protein
MSIVAYYILVYPSASAVRRAYPLGVPWAANILSPTSSSDPDIVAHAAYCGGRGPNHLCRVNTLYVTYPWSDAGLQAAKKAYPQVEWNTLAPYGNAPALK